MNSFAVGFEGVAIVTIDVVCRYVTTYPYLKLFQVSNFFSLYQPSLPPVKFFGVPVLTFSTVVFSHTLFVKLYSTQMVASEMFIRISTSVHYLVRDFIQKCFAPHVNQWF